MKQLLLSTLLASLLSGCTIFPRASASSEQFQEFNTKTIWTFAKPAGIPEELPGWKIDRLRNGIQVHLKSPKGVPIYYEESLPALFLSESSTHGFGQFKKIPGMNKPIFEVEHNGAYARGDSFYSDHLFFVGFAGSRRFELIAKFAESRTYTTDKNGVRIYPNYNRQISFDEAVSLAVDVYDRISK